MKQPSLRPKCLDQDVSEETPLLVASSADKNSIADPDFNHTSASSSTLDPNDEDVPLPKLQIFLLCVARFADPLVFFSIFPFVNKMIKETGHIDEKDVGFYSGTIESLYSFTQMLFMIPWGRIADRCGRKPVLVYSLIGMSLSTAMFGFARSIPQMVIFRCCAGLFAGTVVTVRAMITENSTPKTAARAFSFFAFSSNIGIFFGPVIGGALSNPADQYPSWFGGIQFFKDFPYAFPTIVNGSVIAVTAMTSAFFLKETLKSRSNPISRGEDNVIEAPMSISEILKSPGIPYVLFQYTYVMLLGLANTAVLPVFLFTPVHLGGCGLEPIQISTFLGVIGISQAIWLLVIFPLLHDKYGTAGILRLCFCVWPLFFAISPICNEILRSGHTTAFWVIAPMCQVIGSGVTMAFTCMQLKLNNSTPSNSALGTLNGVALTMTSALRAVGPAMFTSVFAEGVHSQILHGHLVWVMLVTLAAIGSILMRCYPEPRQIKSID